MPLIKKTDRNSVATMATNINPGANVIFVNTTNSSGVINLPYTGDGIGRTITFQDTANNFGVNPLTLATINGDTFEDLTTVRAFSFSGLTLTMIAGPNGVWFQSRIVGYTGSTGATGAAGSPGSTGTAGDRYLTASSPAYIVPTINPSETLQVDTNLAYMQGTYVLVVDSTDINNYFNAVVELYDKDTGSLTINNFTNINGLFGYADPIIYNVNLNGIQGPTGPTGIQGIPGTATNTGATGPQGVTGAPGVAGPISTKAYYVSKTLEGLQTVDKVVVFDQLDTSKTQGSFDAIYDTNTGILSNPQPYDLLLLLNFAIAGPNGYPWTVTIKDNTSNTSLWNWVVYPNQSGSENFSTTIILKPNHQVAVVFNEANGSQIYRFQKNSTRIIFTQLEYILGAVGPTGCTGDQGIPGTSSNTGATGTTGPRGVPGLATNTGATGPPGTVGALPSSTFYYSQNTPEENGVAFTFQPDALDTNYSFGTFSGTYDPTTGILTNNTENVINYIVDIQLAADTGSSVYFSFKYSNTDELIWMSNYVDDSTINSDSHTITLYPNQGFYTSCYVTNNVGNWNILGNNTSKPSRVKFTQLEYVMSGGGGGGTGFTGPTGPSFTKNNIPSASYYLSAPIIVSTEQEVDVVFDIKDNDNSDGAVAFIYSTETGTLTNSSQDMLTLLVSGQITTNNTQFDASVSQPVIYLVKNNDNIISSSVINFQGSSFSSSVIIAPGDFIKIKFSQYFQNSVNINPGRFSTRITFSQLDYIVGSGIPGPSEPTNLPTKSYYLTEDTATSTSSLVDIIFNAYDAQNSDGVASFNYSTETGSLTNPSQGALTLLVSGQITTDNTQFDYNVLQPVIYIVKNGDNILSSSVINFQGSSFSSSVVILPGEFIKIQYVQYFQNTVNIKGGKFSTRICFSQLDYISSGGGTGPTGPPGLGIPMYSITFDGGSSSNSYIAGPAFDCGSSS
jgi:hypothetical protein